MLGIGLHGDILTIKQLAEYLMVSEKTVYRLLDRNQLPAVRVGAQWRFRRQDIDQWLADEVRRVELEGKRGVYDEHESSALELAPLLEPMNVWIDVRPKSRDALLAFMISEARLEPHVDREILLGSVRDREALCSTAMIEQAAFPHPFDPRPFRFNSKRVLLAVLAEPLDWLDPHGHRPRIVAMILARSTQGQLLALSRAMALFGSPQLVDDLSTAADASSVIARIAAAEARITADIGEGA